MWLAETHDPPISAVKLELYNGKSNRANSQVIYNVQNSQGTIYTDHLVFNCANSQIIYNLQYTIYPDQLVFNRAICKIHNLPRCANSTYTTAQTHNLLFLHQITKLCKIKYILYSFGTWSKWQVGARAVGQLKAEYCINGHTCNCWVRQVGIKDSPENGGRV